MSMNAPTVQTRVFESEFRALLQDIQNESLEAIARGLPLLEVATQLCARIERLVPEAICSILTVDSRGVLHPLAAPSLPEAFTRALDGMVAGPRACACGTAVWRGESVAVSDIFTDDLCVDYRASMETLGLRASWSSPIKAGDGQVIGTFAFYYRVPRGPTKLERDIVDCCVNLCSIAIEQEENRARIRRLAFHDILTGLPNRTLFRERAAQMLASLRGGQTISLCYIDLNDFKGFNEALGHSGGDHLLAEVAKRFASSIDPHAFVARVGGDEFAVMTEGADDSVDMKSLAARITALLEEPFAVGDQTISLGASIGIAQSDRSDMKLTELSRRAGMALHEAKREGPGTAWRPYAPEIAAVVQSRRTFKQDIRNAIEAGDFTLVYQPIVALADNRLTAVEALLRWNHPERGAVSPGAFVPVVEEMGWIGVLGDRVLREACTAAAAWPREITVCVNLSPIQFRKPGFVLDVISALHQAGLPPQRLDLEITESALLARDLATRTALHDLHDFGARLSIDDFGTGFSSLVSLRSFPFDKLKIDGSFVRDIGIDKDSNAIVRAVIGLARDLCITTIAEGIETQTQFEWLNRHGCTEGQGFYFAHPMSGSDLQALLESPKRIEELILPAPASSSDQG